MSGTVRSGNGGTFGQTNGRDAASHSAAAILPELYAALDAAKRQLAYAESVLAAAQTQGGRDGLSAAEANAFDADVQRRFANATAALDAEAQALRDAELLKRPFETAIKTQALFGHSYEGEGWPIAFDVPFEESSHDLFGSGQAWAIGYMEVVGEHWRPVVPVPLQVPESPPPGDPGEPGGPGKPEPPPREKKKPKKVPVLPEDEDPIFLPPAGLTPEQREELLKKLREKALKDRTKGRDSDDVEVPCDPPEGRGKDPDEDDLETCDSDTTGPRTEQRSEAPDMTGTKNIWGSVLFNETKSPNGEATDFSTPRPGTTTYVVGQGRSRIGIARPKGLSQQSDERARLGGGPFHPQASLVPRGGVTLIDPYDIAARSHTVWDVASVIVKKVNQVVSLMNDKFPFGPSALDNSGLFLGTNPTFDRPALQAFDGTITMTKRDGTPQLWVADHGSWKPTSFDFQATRVIGANDKSKDIVTYYATGKTQDPKKLPAIGYYQVQDSFVVKEKPLDLEAGLRLVGSAGIAEFTTDLLDDGETREIAVPNASGTLALTSDIVTDHGALGGLTDDDHTSYARLAGRGANQTLSGGDLSVGGGASDYLVLRASATSGVPLIQLSVASDAILTNKDIVPIITATDDLGASSNKFADLHLSGQVNAATMALGGDAYAEGSVTAKSATNGQDFSVIGGAATTSGGGDGGDVVLRGGAGDGAGASGVVRITNTANTIDVLYVDDDGATVTGLLDATDEIKVPGAAPSSPATGHVYYDATPGELVYVT